MELADALEFAGDKRHGVLVTLRRDLRPQLSNVMYHLDEAGTIRISITAERAKYHNMRREPWAALHVTHYEQAVGQHDDWGAFRQAMVDDRRVIARLRPTRAYGMLPMPRG